MNINSGGHIAQLNFLKIAQSITNAEPVTYRQREADTLFLDDLIRNNRPDNNIYVIHWGPDIAKLVQKLKYQQVVYFAHSTGYSFQLPARIPIITVSKHSQAYWGRYAPNSLLFHLPNEISEQYTNLNQDRPIDVLVQKRKSSQYLINELVPALTPHCNLVLIDYWVDDLASLFNQCKVYLYDSTEFWVQAKASEGFGLPPLEAMACGCTVFSSLNDALSDYLDPSFNCHKIRVYSQEFDRDRILSSVNNWQNQSYSEIIENYRFPAIKERFSHILQEINLFFDHQINHHENIPPIQKNKPINIQKIIKKIRNLLKIK
jgi:glycosyltransferase involved in cell wall biosynthesis